MNGFVRTVVLTQRQKVTRKWPISRERPTAGAGGGGGGYFQKNWVGVCDPLPKTLTLFMTKIYVFCYPIYDLSKNSKPHL